uniref:Hexosyltransferase n=2 Tax=Nothobranchius korthausae TaxID=1143690 RepID=A0A1A8G1Z6_9TELE
MLRDIRKKRILKQLFLLLGAVLMIVFISKYNTEPSISRSPHRRGQNNTKVKTRIRIAPDVFPMPKCEQNMSVTNMTDFKSLPNVIKTFLYYRHCRHFPMLLDAPDKCGGANESREVFLLLVIKSSPKNYDRREVLRKTWAKERLYKGAWIRRLFIVGTSGENNQEKAKLNTLLQMEQEEFGDILQWDFIDSFHNLTLKQTLFLQWVQTRCSAVPFLFNGDDDVFANTDNIIDYLQSLEDNDGSKHLFTGYLFIEEKVVRWTGSKYFIPVQIQETNTYPPYCGGGGYLLSGFTASVIHQMSQNITIHPIDDAYMGMCLAKAGLKPTSHSGVKTLGLNVPSKQQNDLEPCFLRQLLLVHQFLPPEMYVMWKQVNDPHLKCSPSTKLR